MNLARLFLRPGDDIAVTHVRSATSSISRTSSELLAHVTSLAAGLRRLGMQAGDRILILGGSRVEAVESILSVFAIGGTAMPVNPLLGEVALRAIIERMQPVCCIFEHTPDAGVQDALRLCRAVMISLKARDKVPAAGWHSYQDLLTPVDLADSITAPAHFAEEHPALVIHSSGSSGMPKAIVMRAPALLAFIETHDLIYAQYSSGPDSPGAKSPILTGLPLSHLAGLGTCLQGLLRGRPSCLMSFFLPEVYLRLVEKLRCSFIMLVPSLYRALLNEPYLREMDTSALQFCISGGEPCPTELMERIEAAFGVLAVNAYSMTECLSGIAHGRRDLFDRSVPHGSCGRQFFGEVKLVDPQGQENGEFGELWVRNATVHRCYLDAELNEARLSDGWFRTHDLFQRDADGEFFHHGRADDMFICNGKNIYPLEIELLLRRHPAIENVCAAPVDHPAKGTIPAALIVSRHPLTPAEIQDFAMKNGSSHIVPQIVRLTDQLPALSSGKLDRQAVARLLQEACDAVVA